MAPSRADKETNPDRGRQILRAKVGPLHLLHSVNALLSQFSRIKRVRIDSKRTHALCIHTNSCLPGNYVSREIIPVCMLRRPRLRWDIPQRKRMGMLQICFAT